MLNIGNAHLLKKNELQDKFLISNLVKVSRHHLHDLGLFRSLTLFCFLATLRTCLHESGRPQLYDVTRSGRVKSNPRLRAILGVHFLEITEGAFLGENPNPDIRIQKRIMNP